MPLTLLTGAHQLGRDWIVWRDLAERLGDFRGFMPANSHYKIKAAFGGNAVKLSDDMHVFEARRKRVSQ